MFSSFRRKAVEPEPGTTNGAANVDDDETAVDNNLVEEPVNASQLIGGMSSGVSLDGRSLILPNEEGYTGDDVSSINTSTYDYRGSTTPHSTAATDTMRILGTMDHDEELPNGEVHQSYSSGKKSMQAQQHPDYEYRANGYNENSAPQKGKTDSQEEYDDGEDDGGCLPLWITEAPTWLKMVIVMSTALLIGAVVLIGIGAAIAVQENNEVQEPPSSSGTAAPVGPIDPPAGTPPSGPTTPTSQDTGPPAAPSPVAPGATAAPTATPTVATPAPTSSTFSFLVMGGRFTGDTLLALPDQLASLPTSLGNELILFHLGDWNSPFATSCVESSYSDNVDLYKNSAVPVYFVPGDNEFNDCPSPTQAFGFWDDYILGMESEFWPAPTAWSISRQNDHQENFAFAHNNILMVGINLVGGVVHDQREWQDRHEANLAWIDANVEAFAGQFTVICILAHADPDIQANDGFFNPFYQRVVTGYSPYQVFFLHRNLGVETWGEEPFYQDIENLTVVVVEGSLWPPMLVEIDTISRTVVIDQETWYDTYLESLGEGGR